MSPALAVLGTGKFGWAYPLASGDFDFITSASGTTVSSLSLDNCFSAGYDHYLIMRNLLGSTANAAIQTRLRVSSTDDSGANYRYQNINVSSTTVTGARTTGLTNWAESFGYTEATAYGFAQLWISNPFATVRTTAWANGAYFHPGNILLLTGVYEHDLTTSYDGLTVLPTAGTLTGSLYVYGLAV